MRAVDCLELNSASINLTHIVAKSAGLRGLELELRHIRSRREIVVEGTHQYDGEGAFERKVRLSSTSDFRKTETIAAAEVR